MITLPGAATADRALDERREAALLDRVDAALDAEREALLRGDEDRLTRTEREKSSIIDALVALQSAPQHTRALRERLHALADKNRLNGRLISDRLADVLRRRQFFERAAGRDSIYGPDGVTHPAGASRSRSRS